MALRASERFLSIALIVVFFANIGLAGCSQKNAQNAAQSTPTAASGGLGGSFGGSAASPAATSSADSAAGNGNMGNSAGGVAACVVDIFNNPNAAITPRQAINQATARFKLLADNVPKADVSVNGLADSLPNDANLVDQYVRDQIRLDIYPGAMRGSHAIAQR